jgi:phosphatidate cytidylyltransferase
MSLVDSLHGLFKQVADATGTPPPSVGFVAAMVLALAAGTLVRIVFQRIHPTPHSADLLASLKTWWGLIAVLMVLVLFGRTGAVISFALLSTLALREFSSSIPKNGFLSQSPSQRI